MILKLSRSLFEWIKDRLEKTVYITGCFCRKQSGQDVIIHFNPAILFFPYEPLSMSLNDAVLKLFMERNYMPVIKAIRATTRDCPYR
ncbi:MAG: hypothetical protein C0403_19750 [Desulfobacterium sp.]|nr:hypothetical protein [Desulfobacterium sp.]